MTDPIPGDDVVGRRADIMRHLSNQVIGAKSADRIWFSVQVEYVSELIKELREVKAENERLVKINFEQCSEANRLAVKNGKLKLRTEAAEARVKELEAEISDNSESRRQASLAGWRAATEAEARVKGLGSVVTAWIEAKDALHEFEREHPNDSTRRWDERLFAVESAEQAIRQAAPLLKEE